MFHMKAPLLVLACCFAIGILTAQRAPLPLIPCLVICGVCWVAGLIFWQNGWQALAGLLALSGFMVAGVATARLSAYRFPPNHVSHLTEREMRFSQPVRLEGKVDRRPLLMPYGLQFDLDTRSIWSGGTSYRVTGKIRLYVINGRNNTVPAASLNLRYGDSIIARVRIERPQNYANPGGFDYRKWLESVQDIYWQGSIEDPGWVRNLSARNPRAQIAGVSSVIERIRQRLLTSIDRLYPPWTLEGKNGAVLKAVLLGDRSSLDSDTIEDFRRTGLYHLLVVAGLHVGLLAMLAEALLRLLRIPTDWRAALLLMLLAFYASLVDQRAPTLRASLMIGAYLLARLLDREQPVLNAVGLAALILLFERPGWLADAGFQLSFAAALLIAGLALPILERTTEPYRRALWHLEEPALDREFAPHLAQFRLDIRDASEWVDRQSAYLAGRPVLAGKAVSGPLKVGIWAINLLIFSAVLQFGLLLPMAEIFHRVTLAGIGLNVFAIPCMTVLLAVAVPTILLNAFFPVLAVLPGKLLTAVLTGLFGLTELKHMPQWLSYRVATPPIWVAWGFALALFLAACTLALKKPASGMYGMIAVLLAALICLQPFAPRIPKGMFEVTDLDCGGGDSVLMVFPDRSTMLMGACGRSRGRAGASDPVRTRRWDPGENIVSTYLWSRGIKAIDVFLLPDSSGDHLSGVAAVLRSFTVKEFWCAALPPPSMLDLLSEHQVRIRRLLPGDALSRGGASVAVVWPTAKDASRVRASGISPFLIRVSNSEGSILLDGGLTASDLDEVKDSTLGVQSEVLQVSSGAELSAGIKAFAVRVHPSLILAGSEGSFGRKSRDDSSFGLLNGGRRRVLNVATDGAVTVELRGDALVVRCYLAPCR
jgi:competence protein ComEC